MSNNSRYIFEAATERDIDLVIMLLCGESTEFVNKLLEPLNQKAISVDRIIHSQTHPEYGESDITIIVQCENKRIGILLEDKIDAIAMPEQSARYNKRAALGIEHNEYDESIIYIVAPQDYLDNNQEAKKYPNRMSYEDLIEFINDTNPSCYEFAKALINQALLKEKSGYKVLEDVAVTQFWNDFYHYLVENTADITMPKPEGAKGVNSTWIPFYHNLRHTSLQYKTNFGCVDLEFTGTAHCSTELKSRLKPYLSENMIWAETGKSMSLRICVPKTDVHRPFATYIADMPQITLAIRELMNTATSINNDGIIDDLLK